MNTTTAAVNDVDNQINTGYVTTFKFGNNPATVLIIR